MSTVNYLVEQGNDSPLQYSCLENPWTEEPGRLQSMGSLRGRTRLCDFTFTFHFRALEKDMATYSSVLAWRIPGMGEPGGCRLGGRTESDTTEATWQQQQQQQQAHSSLFHGPRSKLSLRFLLHQEPKVGLSNAVALWTFSVTTTFSWVFTGNSNQDGWISV